MLHLSLNAHRRALIQSTRNGIQTGRGESDRFIGATFVDAVAVATGASEVAASSVHFTPGARTAWHTHPKGQTVYVTEGVGLVQRRGGCRRDWLYGEAKCPGCGLSLDKDRDIATQRGRRPKSHPRLH